MVFHLHNLKNRVARNFCGSLFLQICDFFCVLRALIFAISSFPDKRHVNGPTNKASWPERLHMSVNLNIIKRISMWSLGVLSDGLHNPPLERINWNAGLG